MMNEPLEEAARDAETQPFRDAAIVPFRILSLNPVSYGSKKLEFTLEMSIGRIEMDLFAPEGRDPFVRARSIRSKYTGGWERTLQLDPTFAGRVLEELKRFGVIESESAARG